jgi:hypothetical protein
LESEIYALGASGGLFFYQELDGSEFAAVEPLNYGYLAYNISYVEDGKNSALKCSGDGVLQLGNFTVAGSSELTISAFIKPTSFRNDARIISRASGPAVEDHDFMVSLTNDGPGPDNQVQFRLRINIVVGNCTATLGGAQSGPSVCTLYSNLETFQGFEVDRWYHIAAVYGTNQMKIYVDGVLVAAADVFATITTEASTNTPVLLCANSPPPVGSIKGSPPPVVAPYDGLIDDVRIYKRELSKSEICALKAGGEWSNNLDFSNYVVTGTGGSQLRKIPLESAAQAPPLLECPEIKLDDVASQPLIPPKSEPIDTPALPICVDSSSVIDEAIVDVGDTVQWVRPAGSRDVFYHSQVVLYFDVWGR